MYMLLIRLLLIIVTIPSIIAVFNPLLAWKLREGWKFKNAQPQPSDSYLLLTRIGGILGTIVCFVVLFLI